MDEDELRYCRLIMIRKIYRDILKINNVIYNQNILAYDVAIQRLQIFQILFMFLVFLEDISFKATCEQFIAMFNVI